MKKKKPVLELKGVGKDYDMGPGVVVNALCGINMSIHEGEYVSILGPSGSGKSTLMHMMGLLDVPTSGEVWVGGKFAGDMSDDEMAYARGRKIGFVFQVFNLIPSLTALENVVLPMMIYGVPAGEREKRALSILEQLGMNDRAKHKPMELSGGQRQRVAIARALANDPPIILADEPTGNLDSKTGKEVAGIFKELNRKGKTMVVVTHDEEIAKYADRVIRIRDGRILGSKC